MRFVGGTTRDLRLIRDYVIETRREMERSGAHLDRRGEEERGIRLEEGGWLLRSTRLR